MEKVLSVIQKCTRTGLFGLMIPVVAFAVSSVGAKDASFILPIDCKIGETCFLQNFADLDRKTPLVVDTICGAASYNGHKGIDIRVKDIKALQSGIDILAVSDGVVVGTRNTALDRRVKKPSDRAAVRGRECGNGVAIRHANQQISQLCHLKRGSVLVKTGDPVKQGQKVGEMGLSGFTTFPHVHLSLSKNKQVLDPLTGKSANSTACTVNSKVLADTKFGAEITASLIQSSKAVMELGLAGEPFDLARLVEGNVPKVPTTKAEATLGWAWLLNVKKGDRVYIKVTRDGETFAESLSEPINRHKATYFYFAGRSRPPKVGAYRVTMQLQRQGQTVRDKSKTFTVQK